MNSEIANTADELRQLIAKADALASVAEDQLAPLADLWVPDVPRTFL